MMRETTREQNEQIRTLMREFVGDAIDFYNGMENQRVLRPFPADTRERLERMDIPVQGRPVREVYSEMLRDVYSSTLLPQHPRSFSCVPSTASPLSWMGDVMTNAYNPHAGCQVNVQAAGLVERKLIRWMCGLAGYPEGSGGLFVSGGSIANLTALTAARDAKLTHEERDRAVIYVSEQTHSSVSKGLHIIGFRKEQIRVLPTDDAFRMDLSFLRAAVARDAANGKKPFAVVASAGTTNTGSVDPLSEISALCREYGMWMHVDGAYGASALLSRRYRKELSGIELSDSLSWDAHKWMMQTYGCSVVLVRDQTRLTDSFATHPEYLKDAEEAGEGVEFWDLGPELTRPARGLKLWLTLQTLGSEEMGRVIEHGCAMAELAERAVREAPGWEIVSPAQLGIVNFRYAPEGVTSEAELDQLNQRISKEITESGFAQVFTTELRGRKVLRICAINPETAESDILETVSRLRRAASGRLYVRRREAPVSFALSS